MHRRVKKRDVAKERYWRKIIREGARSGLSIREFCRRNGITENQFYRWQRELKHRGEQRRKLKPAHGGRLRHQGATFALVTDESEGWESAGIELVLPGGRRLRIGKGVDEDTLAGVLNVLERDSC